MCCNCHDTKVIWGIHRCEEGVILPQITEGNAGVDLRVLTGGEPVVIPAGDTHVFKTGIKMDIPEGYYVEVVVRSSVGIKKKLRLMNTVAVLDNNWKGETLIGLHNFGLEPVTVENNERVCQMLLKKDEARNVKIVEVSDVGQSNRGEAGIGSTNYNEKGERVL